MTAVFSAATEPWIDVADRAGRPGRVGLVEVLEAADELSLASPDPLVWAATARLLTVIAYQARCGPGDHRGYVEQIERGIDLAPAVVWVREHEEDLDLFHPRWPLLQDGALREVAGRRGAGVPVLVLDLAAAVGRPLLADHRPLESSSPVSGGRALELLLVQQMWAVSGRIRGAKNALFGRGAADGRSAPAAGGIVWQPSGTVAEMLAWRLAPVPGLLGRADFTHSEATSEIEAASELDGLLWQPRRMLLVPGAGPGGPVVERVLVCQGWRMAPCSGPGSVAARPGSRDLVDDGEGRKLSARALTGEEDTAPLLERWWRAPEGSWARAARAAVAELGRAPDVVAVGLGIRDYTVITGQRRVTLPGRLLSDPRAGEAAAAVVALRARARQSGAGRRLPPAFGSSLLSEPSFLAATADGRDMRLLAAARGVMPGVGDRDAFHRTALLPPQPSPDDGEDGASGEGSQTPARPGPGPGAVAAAGGEAADDEDLFVTAGTPAGWSGRDDPWSELPPAYAFTRRLGRWALHPRTRPRMREMGDWTALPGPPHGSEVYRALVKPLPPGQEWERAGWMTAALFARHRHHARAAPLFGAAPLPRLMRAAGTIHRGPAHPATRALMVRILRTREPGHLLPHLARAVEQAARQGLTPHWAHLFTDLTRWTTGTRELWADLFYTPVPLPLPLVRALALPDDTHKDPHTR
ncbi:type I-E CRISPR-associated protein Cse1/CasA [Streptomyces clavuligerus]|uniref:type I-E CRISPR-associated protein Cse1/CasA n=2 Tax=Streptomyces clavuligerus TaxID=1901 RepID=UPI00020D926C|nr:type I-E CRISPR-associated protein Cse1/CasA [Streptomyces clavuligerus]WDN55955.1 type I-E CRISPR-associated protein Cse1/CasA [Streptomyces clavuligerus]